jgi:hypothetical protein
MLREVSFDPHERPRTCGAAARPTDSSAHKRSRASPAAAGKLREGELGAVLDAVRHTSGGVILRIIRDV